MTATPLYVTEVGYPEPDRGPLQVLHSPAISPAESGYLDALGARWAAIGRAVLAGYDACASDSDRAYASQLRIFGGQKAGVTT
jgi:hypothetical protein